MDYKYNTPENAVISLEKAYSLKDLKNIIASKNFKAEAKILLQRAKYNYDLNDNKLIEETAKLLELELIKNLQENGYPNFDGAIRDFSKIEMEEGDLYSFYEKITYPDSTNFVNKIFLTNVSNIWKVAMIEEYAH